MLLTARWRLFMNKMALMAIKENERRENEKGWGRKQCRMEW